jgi:hypothetical protein
MIVILLTKSIFKVNVVKLLIAIMGCGSSTNIITEPKTKKCKPCVVILGGPGSGASTQAKKISEKYKFK